MKTHKLLLIILLLSSANLIAQPNYRMYIKLKDNVIPFSKEGEFYFNVNKSYVDTYLKNIIMNTYYSKKGGKKKQKNNYKKNGFISFVGKREKEFYNAVNDFYNCRKENSSCLQQDSIKYLFTNLFDSDLFSRILDKEKCIGQAPNLLNIFTLCHCDLDCLLKFKLFLEKMGSVEYVEIEKIEMLRSKPSDNTKKCLNDNFMKHWEEYEMSALWKHDTSAYGQNANIIIIEENTKPALHVEYDSLISSVFSENTLSSEEKPHATNVFGILKSNHQIEKDSIDCRGLVPNANIKAHISFIPPICGNQTKTNLDSVSYYSNNSLSNAILFAVSIAKVGDIVLIPYNPMILFPQKGPIQLYLKLPIDGLRTVREILKLGECKGITFVQSAGNANIELNLNTKQESFIKAEESSTIKAEKSSTKNYIVTFKEPPVCIIVGATTNFENKNYRNYSRYNEDLNFNNTIKEAIVSTKPYNPKNCDCPTETIQSSFGNYITCFQMGANVITTDLNKSYCNFTATSAASTIVAGMLASVQSLAKEKKLRYLSSQELKNLLNSGIPVFREGTNTNKFLPTGTSLLKGLSELNP